MLRRSSISPGDRVVLWDNNDDHEADARCGTLSEFFRTLADAERSGKAYRVAYNGDAAPHLFEQWAHGVWSILDGNRITRAVIEEYSDCCRGPGLLDYKKDAYHRRLWTQGRKYGLILDVTSQRPQLISKDSLGNAGIIWAGHMDTSAAERIGKEIDIPWRDIMACKVGEFYRKDLQRTEKIKVFDPR